MSNLMANSGRECVHFCSGHVGGRHAAAGRAGRQIAMRKSVPGARSGMKRARMTLQPEAIALFG
jgi:hypothetical protein